MNFSKMDYNGFYTALQRHAFVKRHLWCRWTLHWPASMAPTCSGNALLCSDVRVLQGSEGQCLPSRGGRGGSPAPFLVHALQ